MMETAIPQRLSRVRYTVPGRGLEEIPSVWICRLDALDPLLDVTGRLIGVNA